VVATSVTIPKWSTTAARGRRSVDACAIEHTARESQRARVKDKPRQVDVVHSPRTHRRHPYRKPRTARTLLRASGWIVLRGRKQVHPDNHFLEWHKVSVAFLFQGFCWVIGANAIDFFGLLHA
jgi:hypothetical protein